MTTPLTRNPDGTLRNCFNCQYYRIPLRRFPWCNRKDARTEINATCPDYEQRAEKVAVAP